MLTPDQLQDRLIDVGANVGIILRQLPRDLVAGHVAKQLIRSATSPAANYAEARAAESRRDFVHKMQIALKELRETRVWLRLIERLGPTPSGLEPLIQECLELVSIFAKSVKTARGGGPI
ncbi:MAG TPA: four helix bundle protein [Gemmatimonadales bacterium]|jgi:four helix bundle protein